MPKVSIVVPTYNRAHFLPETLDSILAQTYRDFEVLVVDNASTDSTPELMDVYMARDPRMTYIRKPVNKGVLDSYHLGWHKSSGEYLAFLDSDDTMLPTRLEKQTKILKGHPDVDLVYTNYYYIDATGRRLRKSPIYSSDNHLEQLVRTCIIQWNTMLTRRKALDTVGRFDESLTQSWDWDFLLQLALNGSKFVCIQEPLNNYRMHPNNLTRNVASEEQALRETIRRTFADPRLPEHLRQHKDQSLATNCFWLAYGSYHSQRWDDAKRNLMEAWSLTPEWHANHDLLVNQLRDLALMAWVFNPVEFMQGVLDHLPPEVQWLERERVPLLVAMHIGTAFRHVNLGEIDQFQQQMLAALELAPDWIGGDLPRHSDIFLECMCGEAEFSPMESPTAFVDAVMNHLPPQLDSLRRLRSRILSGVNVTSAYADYLTGNRARVPKHVLRAVRYRPTSMVNRGIVSIFVRSLPAAVTGPRSSPRLDRGG